MDRIITSSVNDGHKMYNYVTITGICVVNLHVNER